MNDSPGRCNVRCTDPSERIDAVEITNVKICAGLFILEYFARRCNQHTVGFFVQRVVFTKLCSFVDLAVVVGF